MEIAPTLLTCLKQDYSYLSLPALGPPPPLSSRAFLERLRPSLSSQGPTDTSVREASPLAAFPDPCACPPEVTGLPLPLLGFSQPVLWYEAASTVSSPRWWDDDDVFAECPERAAPVFAASSVAQGREPGNLVPSVNPSLRGRGQAADAGNVSSLAEVGDPVLRLQRGTFPAALPRSPTKLPGCQSVPWAHPFWGAVRGGESEL